MVARDGGVSWKVRFRHRGRQTSETFPTEAAAVLFCASLAAHGPDVAVRERARLDVHSDEYVPTLAEHLTAHVEQLTGVTQRTRDDYHAVARRSWLPELGARRLDTITRADVARVVNGMDRAGSAAKTIRNSHGLLHSVLGTAVDSGYIDNNPCTGMRLPRTGEETRRDERYLTHVEYGALRDAMLPQHRALTILLFGTGLRWGEATALQVGDVNLTGAVPTLRVTKAWKGRGAGRAIGPPKSPKSRRTVMLAAQVTEALVPLLDRPADARLIVGARGGDVWHGSWRDRVWLPACARAGLDPVPRIHDARHSHASWLIEQGATLEMVQDQLGHESILTTRKIYGHLQPAMRAALADAATRALAMS